MNENNSDSAKEQLRRIAQNYSRPLRGKLAVLAPLRDEILDLDTKGATSGEIAAFLTQCQINVSKDTVARFLRLEKAKERSTRAKKSNPPLQNPGSSGSVPFLPIRPRLPPPESQ